MLIYFPWKNETLQICQTFVDEILINVPCKHVYLSVEHVLQKKKTKLGSHDTFSLEVPMVCIQHLKRQKHFRSNEPLTSSSFFVLRMNTCDETICSAPTSAMPCSALLCTKYKLFYRVQSPMLPPYVAKSHKIKGLFVCIEQ